MSLTMVVAPAGYGKTAALAQAVQATIDDPASVDVWLRCDPADNCARVLATSLSASVDAALGRPVGEPATDLTALAELVTSLAPADVCVILDDVHVLVEPHLIDELLASLPANAHLVLAGRTRPRVDLVRHELAGSVMRITQDDLAFDDLELGELLGEVRGSFDPVSRWPAIVALELGSGVAGPIDYLLTEVAAGVDGAHRGALFALAHLDEVDDPAALAATEGKLDAEQLLADLPLVHRSDNGTFRLHDLWRDSLAADRLADDVRSALARVASQRLTSDPVEAAALFARAGATDDVERALVTTAARPLVTASVEDLRRIGAIAAGLDDRPIARLVAASVVHTGDEVTSAERFAEVRRLARQAGDRTVEALALLHEFNMRWVSDPSSVPAELVRRAHQLAPDQHPARIVTATAGVLDALRDGEPDAARRSLDDLTPLSTEFANVYHAFGLLDLGRPELVSMPDDGGSITSTAVGLGGQHVAHALWLRGAIDPVSALQFGRTLGAVSDEQQVPHVCVSTNAVLALVALAAGETAVAREHADRAGRKAASTASITARTFARVADAVVAVEEEGDDEAARRLADVLGDVPISAWPPRPYLSALTSVYVLAPSSRPTLDRIRLGPALSTAVAAGRALVALRDHRDATASAGLPWLNPLVLRAHVVPSHLTELAAAAAASGIDDAARLLEEIPRPRQHLIDVVARSGHERTNAWAMARIRELPARPPFELELDVLGSMTLRRDGVEVIDPDWSSRTRVRQLLAYLVHHRRVLRRRLVDDLWPELDATKSLQNLRVNLAHLQRVLQPERERSEPPWFVRATDQAITVVTDGLSIDVDRLEELHRRARQLDGSGRSTEAVTSYRDALALDRGEYLEELPDAPWAEVERARVHALTLAARCRVGELLLAKGEPEEAVAFATDALRIEPLHERAVRLLVEGLCAQGDRAAARRALQHALGQLATQGMRPEPASLKAAERLGLIA